jgi:hypothetical protein
LVYLSLQLLPHLLSPAHHITSCRTVRQRLVMSHKQNNKMHGARRHDHLLVGARWSSCRCHGWRCRPAAWRPPPASTAPSSRSPCRSTAASPSTTTTTTTNHRWRARESSDRRLDEITAAEKGDTMLPVHMDGEGDRPAATATVTTCRWGRRGGEVEARDEGVTPSPSFN